jgi:hypothetical protein
MSAQSRRDELPQLQRQGGTWVRVKPSISFIGTAPDLEVATVLEAAGVRTVTVERQPRPSPSARSQHDGRLPQDESGTGLITAVFDTSITVIGEPLRATARMLGLVLAMKSQYHVVLVAGASLEPGEVAREIETASGRTVGPDFGVCCDPEANFDRRPHRDGSDRRERVALSSDRRAFQSIAALYGALGVPIYFKSFNLR